MHDIELHDVSGAFAVCCQAAGRHVQNGPGEVPCRKPRGLGASKAAENQDQKPQVVAHGKQLFSAWHQLTLVSCRQLRGRQP